MSDQLQIFTEETYQESTSSLLEAHVKTLALLGSDRGWAGNAQALSLKQYGLSNNADHEFLFGRMLKELSPQMLGQILRESSKPLPTLGVMTANGSCSTRRGFYPRIVRECTLSDILQKPEEIGEEYFLSSSQVAKMEKWNAQEDPLAKRLQQEVKPPSTRECNS